MHLFAGSHHQKEKNQGFRCAGVLLIARLLRLGRGLEFKCLLAPGLILLLDDPRIVCYHFHDWQCDLRRLNRVIMHIRARPPQHIVGIGPMIIVWRATPIAEMVSFISKQ